MSPSPQINIIQNLAKFSFLFEQIQKKIIIRLTTAQIYVLTMCRMETKPLEGKPIVRSNLIESHAKLKKSAFIQIMYFFLENPIDRFVN